MKKNFIDLIKFIKHKKGFKHRSVYSFKLLLYFIPILYYLSKNSEDNKVSASQAGDDIYPIF